MGNKPIFHFASSVKTCEEGYQSKVKYSRFINYNKDNSLIEKRAIKAIDNG